MHLTINCRLLKFNNFDCASHRVSPEKIQMQDINVQKNTSSRFSFPTLPAHIVSPGEPVDVRVSVYKINIYSEFKDADAAWCQCGLYTVWFPSLLNIHSAWTR